MESIKKDAVTLYHHQLKLRQLMSLSPVINNHSIQYNILTPSKKSSSYQMTSCFRLSYWKRRAYLFQIQL